MFRALLALMALAACAPAPPPPAAKADAGGWHEFEGSWNATGNRRTLSLGPYRSASIAELRGTLLLAGPSRPRVGFRGEAVTFSDSTTGLIGRAVWTDERGEQVFSEIRGEGTAARNRVSGNFVGGTGRYAGAIGQYEFSWQFVLEAEDGTVQGRAVGLKGRVRFDPTRRPGAPTGGKP